jgi:CHAT domain-containing protein/tetratricopeptide (TPR) repeat protein
MLIRAAMALAVLLLAACAASDPRVDTRSTDADLCEQVDRLLLSGQRNSFGLRFAEAENAFAELLSIYSLQPVTALCPDRPSQAFILMNQALAHSSQERFATASGLFARAEGLLADGSTVPPSQLERERALLAAYRAQDLLNRSSVIGARELAEAAAGAFPEMLDSAAIAPSVEDVLIGTSDEARRTIIDSASNSHARAHILLLEGDLAGASDAINYALDLVDLAPRSAALYRPRFLAERALINYEKRDYEAARADASAAADSFAALLPRSPLEARARFANGRALAALGRTEESLREYETGFRIYEETPIIVEYRAVWPYFRLGLAQAARDPQAADDYAARMFRAAQVIRRSITAQTVAGAAALLGQGDDSGAEAVRAWRRAEEDFATLKALQVIQLQDPLNQQEQNERLARAVADAGSEVERLRQARDRAAPEYAAAIAAPVALGELQAALAPGEALVQIAAGEPRSMIFVVTREKVVARALRATEAQFATLVAAIREAVKVSRDRVAPAFRADLAHVLHELLFSEVRDALANQDKLVVAATGALQSFPFELLVSADPGPAGSAAWAVRGDYTGVRWLGVEKTISYVPSARNLADIRLRAGVSAAPREVAAFGDFVPGVDPQKVLRIADLPQNCFSLARAVGTIGGLPGTAAEVRAVGDLFGAGAEVRTGADFTEEALKAASAEGRLSGFRALHFATHGILWPSPDCFTEPALVVSATDAPDSDGLLTASEIRGLDLDAQLIVLSACDTASTYLAARGGDASSRARAERAGQGAATASYILRESGGGGESLSGLARAFFSAGARAVLATHWPVADAETTRLIEAFFAELKTDGTSFSDALRRAQATLRENPATSHPLYWGAFVLIGDGGQGLSRASGTAG